MKFCLLTLTIFLCSSYVLAQTPVIEPTASMATAVSGNARAIENEKTKTDEKPRARFAVSDRPQILTENLDRQFTPDERSKKHDDFNSKVGDDDDTGPPALKVVEKFHWKPALIQSALFLGFQQGVRAFQPKTYSQFDGKFFADWKRSVKNLRGWRDTDNAFVNYFGHPMQGSTTNRIFINNSDKAKKLEFSKSKAYWYSRLKAMAWSTVWSAQFELGPISEANIGNVGIHQENGKSSMAWVDLVITPTVGTGITVLEDAIDKYVLRKWLEKNGERKLSSKIKLLRSLLTPTISVGNLIRFQAPWKRDTRR